MTPTIRQIAEAIGARAEGAVDTVVTGAAEPADAGPDQIALAMSSTYAKALGAGSARAAMLWADADWKALGLEAAILVPRPRLAMAGLTGLLDPGQRYPEGIHPSAVIDPSAKLGPDVSVGPMACIGPGASIGAGSVVGPQCYIGAEAVLGRDARLHAGVRLMARVRIGDRFIAQAGAVVGSDGHSFVTPEQSTVEQARASLGTNVTAAPQSWVRIHSLGAVIVGDDVELGANACVDSGTIRPTEIANGCKIDNLCHVAHNVRIGRDCLFAACAAVAGSTDIGNNVILGGQVGVSDNITIGDNVVAGGGTKILSRVPAGRVVLGYPAMKMDTHIDTYKALRRLPRLAEQVARLQKAVFKSDENH
ncbi:UDP-3-O-3-hydroxymyristoyl glucosamine N-acyltransferase [Pseudooceanicola batsensis HTCC2597]|uniref:UDP-3-O-acylglucosamine N-acyltransferase n=1 Tax=Pseudooceanicola batsensis (strain ATCC BAA-863 / DSM 15984 / KCTC 12145 / HTCC2597) TaxID=252305 RepID=A3U3S1_PSEBH|nr:UDP-3-O-(3-hydroxymyristoyl)glucosamine N-acyltransferase [Pseudooceanicola batsensis]EAQ01160.1 UDP-3-O-3-hydroxymyristoyl glucosamine N-acyltransferase [Pseudooceanicola batsensis HTCC2597]